MSSEDVFIPLEDIEFLRKTNNILCDIVKEDNKIKWICKLGSDESIEVFDDVLIYGDIFAVCLDKKCIIDSKDIDKPLYLYEYKNNRGTYLVVTDEEVK